MTDSRLQEARAWLDSQSDSILQDQIEIARVPAPSFDERARGQLIRRRLEPIGLDPVFDPVGNLIVEYPPRNDRPSAPVVVAAHLDTVFRSDTQIRIRRVGERWVGAGIADNARGLAVTLAVLRSIARHEIRPAHPLLFAFTVGEEGDGDLRGVKHLLRSGSPFREASAFIAVDGTGLRRIVHRGLAARRYRITISGPGGHSWTDWGRSNPAHVIGELVHRLARLELPSEPRTTVTVARLGGGTSINAIPAGAWVEIDLRSESVGRLERTEGAVREALSRSVASEGRRSGGSLDVEIQIIGERPAGAIPLDHPLVRTAAEATKAIGERPEPATSSTDANVPLALGLPAIALGAGGTSGDVHTENEWFEDTDGAVGAIRILSVLAATAGF